MKGRLDKILASCCLLSRSEAQAALHAGCVTVEGLPARDGAVKVDTERQSVLFRGKPVQGDGFVYLMLYKPVGVLSATEDKKGAVTALSLLPAPYQRVCPGVVGRLDKDAEGLLLLTDNGALNHRMTSPRWHADKRYLVTLDFPVTQADRDAFAQPMDLGDFITQPAALEAEDGSFSAFVTIHEGKYHQIKRMFAHLGKTVLTLKRLSIGPLALDERLSPGEYRPLTQEEIRSLLLSAEMM